MDVLQLSSVLQACLSPDQAHRTAAEAVLKQHESIHGQATSLLRVTAEPGVDAAVRQVAAIAFKNLVKRSWEPPASGAPEPGSHYLSDEEKQVVRNNLLETLIRAPHAVQVQLGEVLKTLVHADHPAKWPELTPAISANLVSQDPVRVHGTLYALRIVARKYEFRDEEDREPMTQLISSTFPVLLHILQQLLASPPTPDVCLYMRLVCKTFWSATYMGIPDQLLEPAAFTAWMAAILHALQQTLPEEQQAPAREDRPSSAWWKSRKWVFHIAYRLVSRYGNPKLCKEGNDQAFATRFQAELLLPFLDAMLGHVANLARGVYMSPLAINLCFQCLSVALNHKACYKHVASHWDEILANVAFPLMCFSDEDAALWVDDPHEYVRKGYDIMEDIYSPKTAVGNFAHELCSKAKAHLDRFLGLLVATLQQFHTAAAAGPVESSLVRRMDGALLAIGTLSELLKNKKPYKGQLGAMVMTTVLPVFGCPYGHLRAKAVWVAGVFSDVQFPDGQGGGPSFLAIFEKVVGLLADPELPVRVDTVIALRHMIDAAEDVESLKPVLPTLLTHIFNLMNQIDAEDLVFSLEALVDKFGSEVAPYAVEMVTQLAAAFEKYTRSAEEGDDEDDDDAGSLAAYGCLRALNTVLESICGLGPQLFPVLEEALYPMLHRLLSSDGVEVMEEVLEMLAYLTYFGPSISPRMWSLWPRIHSVLLECGIDNWEQILAPLDNMICRDTATFLGSKDPDYLTSAFQMAQYSLTGDFGEREVVFAARLLELVLQACRGQIDAWIAPYVGLALQRLQRTETRTLRDGLVTLVANALYYNPALALAALDGLSAVSSFFSSWFAMIMEDKPGGKPKHFRRLQDLKVCALGLAAVLSLPEAALPAAVGASRGLLLVGLTRLLTRHRSKEEQLAKEAEAAEEESEEGEEGGQADDGDWEEDEENAGDADADDAYMKRLQRKAKELMGGDDDDDSDGMFTEDEDVQTPIDGVDPYILFADTLAGLAGTQPAQHAALLAACDADTQAALQALLAHAEAVRQQKFKEQAQNGAAC